MEPSGPVNCLVMVEGAVVQHQALGPTHPPVPPEAGAALAVAQSPWLSKQSGLGSRFWQVPRLMSGAQTRSRIRLELAVSWVCEPL